MRLRPPTRTIRLRLTLIYGAVFLVTAAAMLTIGYLLVRHNLDHHHRFRNDLSQSDPALYRSIFGPLPRPSNPPPSNSAFRAFQAGYRQAVSTALHRLLWEYIVALVAMTGISVALGWWMAGRALAPLRAITATARRVSGVNLGERIALQGPDDELKELADTFDGMLARLDAAFASQTHFVANASHELRTPLAIMRTEVEVTLADPDASTNELRTMAEAVRETIDRSESLIAALLFLARSEGLRGIEEAVDLAELAGGCVTDLHRSAEAAGVTVTSDLTPAVAAWRLRAARADDRQPRGKRYSPQRVRRRAERHHVQFGWNGGGIGSQWWRGDRPEPGPGIDGAVPSVEPHRRRLWTGPLDRSLRG